MLRSQRCTKQNQDTMNIKWIFSSQKETWTWSQVSWRLQVCHTSRFWPLKNSTSNPTDKRNCFLHPQSKWRVERGATEKRLQLEVRVDLNPGPLGYMSEAQTTRPRYLLLFIIFTNWSVGFLFNFCLLLLLLSVFFFFCFAGDSLHSFSFSPGHCRGSFVETLPDPRLTTSWQFYNFVGGAETGAVFPTTVRNPVRIIFVLCTQKSCVGHLAIAIVHQMNQLLIKISFTKSVIEIKMQNKTVWSVTAYDSEIPHPSFLKSSKCIPIKCSFNSFVRIIFIV